MKKLLIITAMLIGAGMAWAARPPKAAEVPQVPDSLYQAGRGDTLLFQQMPLFKGGDVNTFVDWVMVRLQYPQGALSRGISGEVKVRFVVDVDGKVDNNTVEIIKSPDSSLAAAAKNAVKNSPRWQPGVQGIKLKDGTVVEELHPVRVRLEIPVWFVLPTAVSE